MHCLSSFKNLLQDVRCCNLEKSRAALYCKGAVASLRSSACLRALTVSTRTAVCRVASTQSSLSFKPWPPNSVWSGVLKSLSSAIATQGCSVSCSKRDFAVPLPVHRCVILLTRQRNAGRRQVQAAERGYVYGSKACTVAQEQGQV
jgi:hypothetical protein